MCWWKKTTGRSRLIFLLSLLIHSLPELSAPGPSTPSKLWKSNLACHCGQHFIFRPASCRTYSHDTLPQPSCLTDLLLRNTFLLLLWTGDQTRGLFLISVYSVAPGPVGSEQPNTHISVYQWWTKFSIANQKKACGSC